MAAIADKLFPTSADQGAIPTPTGVTSSPASPAGTDATQANNGDMLDRVVQGAHQTIDRLAGTAVPHVQRLQEGVATRAEHVKQLGDEWAESLRGTVRDNPLAAVAAALALGVLYARLTQR